MVLSLHSSNNLMYNIEFSRCYCEHFVGLDTYVIVVHILGRYELASLILPVFGTAKRFHESVVQSTR